MCYALAVLSPNHPNNKLAELTQFYAFTLIVLNDYYYWMLQFYSSKKTRLLRVLCSVYSIAVCKVYSETSYGTFIFSAQFYGVCEVLECKRTNFCSNTNIFRVSRALFCIALTAE